MDEYLRFEGIDGKEAEEFIRAMRVQAFKARKSKDNEWMAELAGTAFAGPALRWYDSLKPEVRDSWEALKSAILSKYSSYTELSPASRIPEAAAAPPPATPSQPAAGSKRGRIRLTAPQFSDRCVYLSTPGRKGVLTWNQDISKALVVQHFPENQAVRIVTDDLSEVYLGAQFPSNRPGVTVLGKGAIGVLVLVYAEKTETGYKTTLHTEVKGSACHVNIWDVGATQTLLPLLRHEGVGYLLSGVVMNEEPNPVGLVSDVTTGLKADADMEEKEFPVTMVFESL